ncbi:uncharacterized protein EHS24_006106 [Apiotrichum porosum]|uniref:Uncharacterized protein n=1 Tax=Apiotrichum porosum TaxID=105984 RepID=A0A427Y0L1_9TREE|nr:uncharacterized protein EHS24_006106 [Apiotrichum porosum]RSH84583.1 hypothetical protein EHS24_006106 [Apiotrichum porosum]
MSEDNSLQRAHQLSAQASVLIRPPDANAATLGRALAAYNAAADLFEKAGTATDASNRGTLRMLTVQHRKLARDLERRISNVGSASAPPSPLTANTDLHGSSVPRRASTSSRATATPSPTHAAGGSSSLGPRPLTPRRSSASAGVTHNAGHGAALGSGFAVHPANARSVPPFSLRPVGDDGSASAGTSGVPAPFVSPGSPYDLHSSSSSSDQPDESFLLPGAIPESSDPFSRFWGMLENMLEEISMPKALTTAPLDVPPLPAGPNRAHRAKHKTNKRSPSPSESFYVVPRDHNRNAAPELTGIGPARKSSPSVKTNEELQLENESLRASLDALAVHAHKLDLANRAFKERDQERDMLVRSVVTGVRREAQRARHDQEVQRSQMLASIAEGPGQPPSQPVAALRTRIVELEEEVKQVKGENDKLRTQLDKFKEKWDKLKAKKEAKVAAAKLVRTSRSPEPGT